MNARLGARPFDSTKIIRIIGGLMFLYLFLGFMLLPCLDTLASIFTTRDASPISTSA